MTDITHIVVHYSATFEDQDISAADIDRWHKAKGWNGIGYHYVIRRGQFDGRIERGRPENMIGAHVYRQNTGKIGICWIGGVNRATGKDVGVNNMTPAQEVSLIKLIKDIKARHPSAKIVGHKDLAATQCPGFDVPAWWARVSRETNPELEVLVNEFVKNIQRITSNG